MMRPGASVRVDAGKAIRELGNIAKRLTIPAPVLKRVGSYVAGLSQQAFRDGRDPEVHVPWEPLTAATLKRRRGKRAQILVDTGRLRKSIHSVVTGRRSVAIGTNVVYGGTHQYGRDNVPARPFLGIDRRGEIEIENIVKRFITSGAA